MSHFTTTPLGYEGHLPARVVLKSILFAALSVLLVAAQSLALLIGVALSFVLFLAIQERIRKLDGAQGVPARRGDNLWVSDGGSFPGREPEARAPITSPRVLDGGSLERLRR